MRLIVLSIILIIPQLLYGSNSCISVLSWDSPAAKFELLVERLNNPQLVAHLLQNNEADVSLLRRALKRESLKTQIETERFFINWERTVKNKKMTLEISAIYVSSAREGGVRVGEREGSIGSNFAIFMTGTLLGVRDYLKVHPEINSAELVGSTIVNPHLISWLTDYGFKPNRNGVSILIERNLLDRLRGETVNTIN